MVKGDKEMYGLVGCSSLFRPPPSQSGSKVLWGFTTRGFRGNGEGRRAQMMSTCSAPVSSCVVMLESGRRTSSKELTMDTTKA